LPSLDLSSPYRALPPFPTRRSSDLEALDADGTVIRMTELADPEAKEEEKPAASKLTGEWGLLERFATLLSEAYERGAQQHANARSEEHTSELQSLTNLVCRLLLEKK